MNEGYPYPDEPSQPQAPRPASQRVVFDRKVMMGPGGLPAVTFGLLVVTIGVFILQYFTDAQGRDLPALYGMKINEAILQGQLWRFITPMFLHGDLMHIGFNMYALVIFGRVLEQYYGNGRFLALYFLSGFAGNVLSFIFSPNPSLGASTAVFGLLGAEGVFLFQNRHLFGERARSALINVVAIAAINLFIGLSPGIDNWGHLGGLVAGTAFAWLAGPVLEVVYDYPVSRVEDQRAGGAVIGSGIIVGLVFVFLAAAVMYLRLS